MKQLFRYIVLVVAFVAVSVSASAQLPSYASSGGGPRLSTEWGVGVKAVYTNTTLGTPLFTLNPRLGFGAQFDMALCIGRMFAIESEVGYEKGTLILRDDGDKYKIKTSTVDIPVLLSLRLLNSFVRISAGPLFSVASKAQYTNPSGEVREFGHIHRTVNLAASVGVRLGGHFLVEARYVHSLGDTLNQLEGVEFGVRSQRASLGFTMLF